MYIIIEVVIIFNEIPISMIVLARPATLYLLVSHLSRGGSRGRVQGGVHPPPQDDLRFSNTAGILPKKNVVYWC